MPARPTILLVEDNAITREMARFVLEGHGFGVVDVPDAAAALDAFANKRFSLVLQDISLPDMDGFDLVARLRAFPHGPQTPILAFSGLLSKLEQARLSSVGFDDLIGKPVEPARLLEAIRPYLPVDRADDRFGGDRPVLLVIEDSVQRELVRLHLTRLGFDVRTSPDGSRALEEARRLRPAALIVEVTAPGTDGFELCANVRRTGTISDTPVILVASGHLEFPDTELAERVEANHLVLHSPPEFREITEALRASLDQLTPVSGLVGPDVLELAQERQRRTAKQLEREVARNRDIARRCSLLCAELAVLGSISQAITKEEDIEAALSTALTTCFDAVEITKGALFLGQDERGYRALQFGTRATWSGQDLEDFFGDRPLLDLAVQEGRLVEIPSSELPNVRSQRFLNEVGGSSALVVPLDYRDRKMGALLMVSTSQELGNEDLGVFAQAVAGQVRQALSLARAFADKVATQRRAEQQLEILSSILESISDAVIVAEGERIVHWNPAAEALFPMGGGEGEHDWRSGWCGPDQTTRVRRDSLPLERAARGESVDGQEVFLRNRKAPEGRWLSINARPLRQDGRFRGGVAVFRDVTEAKAAQAQIMAADRLASVGMLAAGVAHEINNPLSVVLGHLELLDEQLADGAVIDRDDVTELVSTARNAGERVERIVRDLRVFSRSSEASSGAVDIERVLESTLQMSSILIRHRARVVRDYGHPPAVHGVESRLAQVFLNLIMNAAQAIPEGHADSNTIRISTRVHETGKIAVEVSDTGSGITPDAMGRLFNPFFTTKDPGVGTGLGLAISHRIVSECRGEIQVESEPGRGSTFRVLLEPAQIEADAPGAGGPSASVPAPSRARVLVVDDEPDILALMERILKHGHDVATTTRPSEALARIRDGDTFDVILCDLVMPEATGMEFYAALVERGSPQADRVIFVTGGTLTAASQSFLESVPNRRLEKPFSIKRLLALVNDQVAELGVL